MYGTILKDKTTGHYLPFISLISSGTTQCYEIISRGIIEEVYFTTFDEAKRYLKNAGVNIVSLKFLKELDYLCGANKDNYVEVIQEESYLKAKGSSKEAMEALQET